MKRIFLVVFSLTLLCGGAGNVSGAPFVIDDDPLGANTYWGGIRFGNSDTDEDVLLEDSYDIRRMEISFNGTRMTVKIIGDYFSKHPYDGGDLYLSSKGWSVSGTAPHYISDTFTQGEGWDYVITRTGINEATVFGLDFSKIGWSGGGGTYRSHQAWRDGYDKNNPVQTGGTFDIGTDWIAFGFDTKDLGLGPTFGLHFTMSCGNDVIEGEVPGTPVPEPSVALFLICGLVGLAIRKRKQ